MGLFDSIDYEKMMKELHEIWSADDRMTGMIPDTYGDSNETVSYVGRYLNGMDEMTDRIRRKMPRTGDIIRYGNELGKGLWYGAPDYDAPDGYTSSDFGSEYTSPFASYHTEDGGVRFGLDDPASANRFSMNHLAREGAEWVRDNNDELVDRFKRGVSLADDAEFFPDRKTYLADGTIGSEERTRFYKGEGSAELMRGVGYGAVNMADAMIGLVADKDDLIRRPTQRMLDALAYENTGDAEQDIPVSTLHSLGEGIGEMIATGGVTGGLRSGIKRLTPYIPRDLMSKVPVGVQDDIPYRMKNAIDKIPNLKDFLNTDIGKHILDFTTEGVINVAAIRQLASQENWSSEEFEQAMVAATALSVLGLGIATKPKAKPVWESPDWKQPVYKPVANPFGKRYDEIAAEAGPRLSYEGYKDPKTGQFKPSRPLTVKRDEKTKSPLYRRVYKYNFDPKKERNPKRRALLENGNPIMYGVEHYPPDLHATLGKFDKYDNKIHSETWHMDFDSDNERPVPNFENEELKVNVAESLTDKDKRKAEKLARKLAQEPKMSSEMPASQEPFIPQVPLSPSNTLIMEKELERVFGKHAILEETATNKYHVTLPNGVELNVQSYNEIPMDKNHIRNILKKYGFPNRTVFSLKGNLGTVDSYALIQLRDLRDSDTLQHQAVHLAMKTVTTRKEKETLQKLFGPREEDQVAGVMRAIAEERASRQSHPNTFMRKILRRIEDFGSYVSDFTQNVPTAIAQRDWSYLMGKTPQETLKDYAKSFVDGSVWGHDITPAMREFIDSHRDSIAEAIKKEHSRWFSERNGLAIYDRSPNIVSILGRGQNNPLSVDNNIVNKVLLEKHSSEITPQHLARVPQELEHPVLIVRADWTVRGTDADMRAANALADKQGYNFVLNMTDNNDANILVPIGFDYTTKNGLVNKIKSIYGLTTAASKRRGAPRFDIEKFVNMLKSDKLAYVDRDKALEIVKKYRPSEYEAIRDYLYRGLPDTVFTPEKYRVWRNRRGMKADMEQEEYFDRGI